MLPRTHTNAIHSFFWAKSHLASRYLAKIPRFRVILVIKNSCNWFRCLPRTPGASIRGPPGRSLADTERWTFAGRRRRRVASVCTCVCTAVKLIKRTLNEANLSRGGYQWYHPPTGLAISRGAKTPVIESASACIIWTGNSPVRAYKCFNTYWISFVWGLSQLERRLANQLSLYLSIEAPQYKRWWPSQSIPKVHSLQLLLLSKWLVGFCGKSKTTAQLNRELSNHRGTTTARTRRAEGGVGEQEVNGKPKYLYNCNKKKKQCTPRCGDDNEWTATIL